MNPHADNNHPELSLYKPEDDGEIEAKEYKSAKIVGGDLQYFIEVLTIHGGSVKRLKWCYPGEISSSSLLDLLKVLPRVEAIKIRCDEFDNEDASFKFDTETSKLDLSRIKSFNCDSEECLAFFAWLMPDNCLEEFSMKYVTRSLTLERVGKFIQNQMTIKALSLNYLIPLGALMMLTLEKLKLGSSVHIRDVVRALKYQPELKFLTLNKTVDQEAFEEVCNHTKLESLFINPLDIKYGKSLGKLTKLKVLEFHALEEKNQQHFFNFKLESLGNLNLGCIRIHIPDILETIAANFPNLSALKLISSQKLNYIAKLFPTLKKLDVEFSSLWEHSTGIVHQNLRDLKLESDYYFKLSFCEVGELFFELFEIFPNLEVLELIINEDCKIKSRSHTHFAGKDFFAKLNNLKNLKSIKLSTLCWKFEEYYMQEVTQDLKMMARKFDKVEIDFFQCLKVSNPNFDSFLNDLKQDFSVSCYYRAYFRGFRLIKS